MFPLIGALGSIGGAALGAMSADDTANTNWQINLLNYYQRERERKDAIRQGKENKADAYLGSTDSRGDRTHFVQGQGWVTDLAPGSQQMQDAQDQEQMQTLEHDLPARRAVMDRNIQRQREENYTADGLLQQFQRLQKTPTEDVRRRLINDQVSGINDAYGDTTEAAARAAIRSGSSNSAKMLEGLNNQKSSALQKAFLNADQQAATKSDNDYAQERSGIANLYNMFATRGSAMPSVSYQAQNLTGVADANGARDSGRGDSANSALLNAFAKQGGTLDYTQPNNGWANAVGAAGTAISGAGQQIQAQGKNDQTSDLLQQFLARQSSGGVPMTMANSGAWG